MQYSRIIQKQYISLRCIDKNQSVSIGKRALCQIRSRRNFTKIDKKVNIAILLPRLTKEAKYDFFLLMYYIDGDARISAT